MKTTHFFAVITLTLIFTSAGSVIAQPEREHGFSKETGFERGTYSGIPNLTEEQKAKIKELRLTHFKEMQNFRNHMGELKAKQRTLTTADKPDMKAIDANIDEITKVLNSMMKTQAAHRQQVRALLTDEQKMWFDSHPMNNYRHAKMRSHNGNFEHNDGFKGQIGH